MKKFSIISIAILMLASMLVAQGPGKDYPQIPRQPGAYGAGRPSYMKTRSSCEVASMDMLKELNLSDAQTKKLTELQTSQQKAMNTINAEIENLQIDLKQALKNDDFVSARTLNDQLHAKLLVKSNTHINQKEQILKELTPEQKEKFGPMFSERQHGRANGGNHATPEKLSDQTPVQNYRHARRMMNRETCPDCDHKAN